MGLNLGENEQGCTMNMSPRTETKLQDLCESGGTGKMEMYYKGTGSYSQVEAESSHILPLTF